MANDEWLHEFFETIGEDSRVCSVHVCLYFAIRYECTLRNYPEFLEAERARLMLLAKISSTVTYNKCMHDLHDFGYIQYSPFCGRRKSEVRLRKL
jgi:hypothetical protein